MNATARTVLGSVSIVHLRLQTGDGGSVRYSASLREEELKNKVAADWFGAFDCTRIIGNIDFCVDIPATELSLGYDAEPMLWAEAKAGSKKDIVASFVQLILTIGGGHTADKNLPPHFLGAFDAEKIAFIPYNAVLDVLGKNDFDWTVAPSDHEAKEFGELYALAKGVIEREKLLFFYDRDEAELRRFVKSNFKSGRRDVSKILINKNNFTHIYRQWREAVMPFIAAPWDVLKKKYGIYDRDFYLAEMNIDDNGTADIADDHVANDFYITFDAKSSMPYAVKRKNEDDLFSTLAFGFKDGGIDAYAAFWRRYKRPPRKEYWNFIVNRLDLLVPQDVRERKGSFFTPKKWVELSQHYLELALGENWQDEYYVWDCAGGTGNLEVGLTNKYNVFVSTLDQQDIDVIHERIKNGANLLDSHVFQFDFLNDSFDKLPPALKEIIDDPEKRKKLVIYINPPYAEGDNRKGIGRSGVAVSDVWQKYGAQMGYAKRELFVQFLTRIDQEIRGCYVGKFSTPKDIAAPKLCALRDFLQPKVLAMCFIPAWTFDNVKGPFPISFSVLNTGLRERFRECVADVYDTAAVLVGTKKLICYDGVKVINDWVVSFMDDSKKSIGTIIGVANDLQNQQLCRIEKANRPWNHQFQWQITETCLVESCIYLSVRHAIEASWVNHYDQFLCPDEGWMSDPIFQADCAINAIFHDKNRISSADGVNHWIPFTEAEVDAKERFASHFMSDYLRDSAALRENLSPAARSVLDAGRELWRYYHAQPGANPNASYYDIRLHFQGTTVDAKGKSKMKSTSVDETYTSLLAKLRAAMKNLAQQIEPKVYQYGFLRR